MKPDKGNQIETDGEMQGGEAQDAVLPSAVLFVCQLNSIRSAMAEGLMKKHYGSTVYVQSCGISRGELDDLMVAVMRESGVDMSEHVSRTLTDIGDTSFDHVFAFTPDAAEAARQVFEDTDAIVTLWATADPTAGALDVRAMMNNYRSIRSNIDTRIQKRFGQPLEA